LIEKFKETAASSLKEICGLDRKAGRIEIALRTVLLE
jgi:hypothetical protein